jgi:hypothetical protein
MPILMPSSAARLFESIREAEMCSLSSIKYLAILELETLRTSLGGAPLADLSPPSTVRQSKRVSCSRPF